MNSSIDLSGTKLEAEERAAIIAFCKALQEALASNLRSVTLYGSTARDDYHPGKSDINLLVVMEHINVRILKSVLDPVARARRYGISPFIITEVNLRSSADVFPVKFLTMRESHRALLGHDVLADLEVSREHLRLRCEQEIKNLLLRLRRHFIMSGGLRLSQMMSQSIMGFLENLRMVLSLTQHTVPSRAKVIEEAATVFDFDREALKKVKRLHDGEVSLSRAEEEALYDNFMAIVDKIVQITDRLDTD